MPEQNRPDQQIARRCDLGCETWPDDTDFKRCPVCGEKTERFSNGRPLSMDEAQSLKRKHEFERMYEAFDDAREGGLPPMSDEESAYWDEKYPGGRPDNPNEARHRAVV